MPKTKLEKIAGIEEEIRQLENKRKQLVQEQKAVSYTHLDVYKRQVWDSCLCARDVRENMGYCFD